MEGWHPAREGAAARIMRGLPALAHDDSCTHRSLQVIPLLSTSHVATKPTSSNGRTVGAHDLQFNNALVLAFTRAFGARMAQDTGGFASTNAEISRLKPSPVQRRIVSLYLDGVFTNRWTKP